MTTENPQVSEHVLTDGIGEEDILAAGEDDVLLDDEDEVLDDIPTQDPYDTFMKRHLQHYGYFTGRNASFRNNYDGLEEWSRNYDLRLSGTQSLTMDEEQVRKIGQLSNNKNFNLDANFFNTEGQPPDELLSRTTQLVFHYQAGRKVPKLREPRNLYALTKEAGPQQATRWPSHMQVVSSSIRFIDYTPPSPDPFYLPTGNEPTPAVRGSPNGEIVYLNDPGRDMYFMRSRVAGCRLAMRDVSLTPRDNVDQGNFTLEFESRFESGNLLKVVKINDFEYELTLRPDLYTDKHTQWFFFRVRNMVPNQTYRLTIINLMKPSSLYNNGMKPLFYSDVDAKKNKIGWTRAGENIRYYRNNLGSMSGRTYYSLTWTIQFPHKDDTCYFAHCYPYTYTDLQEYLLKLANDPVRSRYCKQRVLCRTLAGNLVYILTITSPSRNPEIARSKKAVVITARVHPGETNASWMMKGFLDFLSGSSADAKLLRDNFIFKIIPMLNPDGVIVGNYRCSLSGRDLNRNYKSVLKDSFPSVWHLKMMVKKLNMEREVVLYCDLHGHSRKNNIFIYGCENKNNPQRKFKERIFPLMLSKNANTKFSYESCKFKIQKSKEGTGRVVMWCMGIMNSYTMEATFGGTSLGSRKGTHFSTVDFEEMGHNFCDTLLDYCDPDASKYDACYQEIQDRVRKQILKRLQLKNIQDPQSVNLDDYSSEYESDTSGSDSSCDDGLPVHLLAIAPKLQRKRRLKTRRDRNKQTIRKQSAPVSEEPKPTPSHGSKSAVEKTKSRTAPHGTSAKRRDDHSSQVSVATGVGQSGLGVNDDRTQKKSDYLEALTTAYIRSGVLMVPEKKTDYSMRYTNGMGKTRDPSFAVQYLASQLNDLTAEEQYEILRRSALRRQLSPAQQRVLAQRHLVAVAQMQQKREQTQRSMTAITDYRRGPSPIKTHPNPFDEKTDSSGASHANSRCPSATQIQDFRKAPEQPDIRPPSQEPSNRTSVRRTSITSNRAKAADSAKPGTAIENVPAAPDNSENPAKTKELKEPNKQTAPNFSKTISSTLRNDQNDLDLMFNRSMQDSLKYKPEQSNSYPEEKEAKQKLEKQSAKNEKAQSESFIANPQDEAIAENVNRIKSEISQRVSETVAQSREVITIPAKRKHVFKQHGILQGRTKNGSPVLGQDLSPLPTNLPTEHDSPYQMKGKKKQSNRPHAPSEAMKQDPFPSTFEENVLHEECSNKHLTLNVKTDISKEAIKKEKQRILSGKKYSLADVIAEGHNSRYRAKNYQGNGDTEGYFGMSDKVGPTSMVPGGRVPPVVANIAELRRSLMGQGRDGRGEDEDNKPASQLKIGSHKHSAAGEESKIWEERYSKRRPINLRPRGFSKYQDMNFVEEKGKASEKGESIIQDSGFHPSDISFHEKSNRTSPAEANLTTVGQRRRERYRHHGPILSTTPEKAIANHHHNSSSDVDESPEEKWPTPNESEIRSYSQGNATIEKYNDNAMTNIRFGSRTTEQRRKLREQWIDVHQRPREVVSSFPSSGSNDTLLMSSVSLNIGSEMDDRYCVTTPALARRPAPPLLRYLSAKQQTTKKK